MLGIMHVHNTLRQSNIPESGYNFFIRLSYFGVPTQEQQQQQQREWQHRQLKQQQQYRTNENKHEIGYCRQFAKHNFVRSLCRQ